MSRALGSYLRQHHLALLALFVALGGVSYAAIDVPNNSVGAGEIRKNAVRSAEVRNNALRGADVQETTFGRVPLASSATIAASAAVAGSSNPEAFVNLTDIGTTATVDAADSKGVTQANVSVAGDGDTYCFHGLPFQPRGGQVTTDYLDTTYPVIPQFGVGGVGGCPNGTQAFVYTDTAGTDLQSLFVVFYR